MKRRHLPHPLSRTAAGMDSGGAIVSVAEVTLATLLLLFVGSVVAGGVSGAEAETCSGRSEEDPFAPFDRRIEAFLAEHKVPGCSLAVTHRGRVVLARGYGIADVEAGEPVTPRSLFRIASLSKPITAVAVLQLIERGQLAAEDRPFDVLDWQAEREAIGESFDSRLRQVTVLQLLQHRGGWDRDASFDPMFRSVELAEELGVEPPADAGTVVRAMLARPLDFDPGQRYAYSNFGYCILGRVIEQVSGLPYEQYVKLQVLDPIGATSMRLGATRLEDRVDQEVRYYHPGTQRSVFAQDLGVPVPPPYGAWCLEAMDAHGGWIATATDLAKFAAALDRPGDCPILNPDSIQQMHDCPVDVNSDGDAEVSNDHYYSCGWSNRVVGEGQVNHWHNGSLPGTLAIMIRRHDDKSFVALLNTRRSPRAENLGAELDRLLHAAANDVTQWPVGEPLSSGPDGS